MMTGYIGTYNTDTTKGIYSFSFNNLTGKISDIKPFFSADDAKCVDYFNNKLIITAHKDNKSGIALIDIATQELLDEIYLENKTPCFIKHDNNFIYTANYHDGVVIVYQLINNKFKLIKKIDIQPKAGCHQVILYQHYLVVPCLLIDEIRIFDVNDNYNLVKTLKFPQGTGPRHGIFNHDFSHFYLISELSSEFFDFQVYDLNFKLNHKLNLLSPDRLEGTSSAAIRLTKDNRYIYISTRGADLLTVISLEQTPTIIQQINAGGAHPRDFILSDDEHYLLVVNRDTDDISSFAINTINGKICSLVSTQKIPHGVGITLNNIII